MKRYKKIQQFNNRPENLAATPEIVINDETCALALSLENHLVKIYEYVRNHFAYEPYWGSQKGSKRTRISTLTFDG